jgi:hypothetical protein
MVRSAEVSGVAPSKSEPNLASPSAQPRLLQLEDGSYLVTSAFELAACFGGDVGRAQREALRSSEQAMRELARRRARLVAGDGRFP